MAGPGTVARRGSIPSFSQYEGRRELMDDLVRAREVGKARLAAARTEEERAQILVKLNALADRYAELGAEREGYERGNPYATFRPWDREARFVNANGLLKPCYHPDQTEVLNWLDRHLAGEEKQGRAFCAGGNGSGKTGLLGYILNKIMMFKPGIQVGVVAESFKVHTKQVMKAVWETRCTSELHSKQKPYSVDAGFGKDDPSYAVMRPEWKGTTYHTGQSVTSRAFWFTYEQGPTALAGYNLDVILWNEPPPTVNFMVEGEARLRGSDLGLMMVFATFIHRNSVFEYLTDPEKGWVHFNLRTENNPSVNRDWLEHELKTLSPEQRAARLEGKPMALGGRCYPAMKDTAPVVITRQKAPPRDQVTLYELIDSHPVKPWTYALAGVDSRGIPTFYRAFSWPKERGLAEFGRQVWRERLGRDLTEAEWGGVMLEDQYLGRSDLIMKRRRALQHDLLRHVPQALFYDSADKALRHGEMHTVAQRLERSLLTPIIDAKKIPHFDRVPIVDDALSGRHNPLTGADGDGGHPFVQFVVGDGLGWGCDEMIYAMMNQEWQVLATEGARERKGSPYTQRKHDRHKDWTDLVEYLLTMLRGKFRAESAPEKRLSAEMLDILEIERRQMRDESRRKTRSILHQPSVLTRRMGRAKSRQAGRLDAQERPLWH